jgi:hypothetical protein
MTVGLCAFTMFQGRPIEAAALNRTPAPNFEYATLFRTGSAAGWYGPGENRSTAKAYELYREMGGKEAEQHFNNAELLSLIGLKGWELAAVTDDARGNISFYFKRPI